MRVELKRLQKRLGITTVYVTHDQSEALALSDEIAVFNAGKIIQRGDAAGHLSPAREPVRRRLHRLGQLPQPARSGRRRTRRESPRSRRRTASFRCSFAQAVAPGQTVLVSARPEDLVLSRNLPRRRLQRAGRQGRAPRVSRRGGRLPGRYRRRPEIRVRTKPEFDFRVGQPVHVSVSPRNAWDCRPRVSRRSITSCCAAPGIHARKQEHSISRGRR